MPVKPDFYRHVCILLRKHLTLLRETRRTARSQLAAVWLLASVLLCLPVWLVTRQQHQQRLDSLTTQLQTQLQQQMQWIDATLEHATDIASLTDQDRLARLQALARRISERQPAVDYLGWQRRIYANQRALWEQEQGRQRRSGFVIRDYWQSHQSHWNNASHWMVADHRPDYLPLTMQEPPPVAALRSMQGLDLKQDALTGPLLQQALITGARQISAPLPIGKGWHFLLLSVSYPQAQASTNPLVRSEQFDGVVVLSVDLERLLGQISLDDAPVQWQLIAPDNSVSSWPDGPALQAGSPWLPRQWATPRLSLPADGYQLQLSQRLEWQQLPITGLLLALTAATLLVYLLWVIIAMRQRQRNIRQRAQDHLYREREHASVTLQAITDAVITFDTRFLIQYLNPSAQMLLGAGLSQVKGQDIRTTLRLSHEFAQGSATNPFTQVMKIRDSVYLTDSSYLTRPSGEKLLVEGSISPFFDQHGQLLGAVLTLRDTAPRRQRMLEALSASEQRLHYHERELARVARINSMGEMASGIAHEINQPLCAILNYCQASLSLLEEEDADMGMVRHAIGNAAMQAQRAGKVIQGLRNFVSKRESCQRQLDLNQVISNALALLEFELQAQEIHLELQLIDKLPSVYADNIELEQVILNLLRNAIDAMEAIHPWGRLTISTAHDKSTIRVVIADNGPGIADAIIDRIFDPFFSTKPNGMGLGLAICQTAIENMGGHIQVRRRPSGGTEFEVILPAHTLEAAQFVAGEKVS